MHLAAPPQCAGRDRHAEPSVDGGREGTLRRRWRLEIRIEAALDELDQLRAHASAVAVVVAAFLGEAPLHEKALEYVAIEGDRDFDSQIRIT